MDESGKKLISGICTLDNCYGLAPNADIVCNSIHLPNEDLWHQRMGHASYKHLSSRISMIGELTHFLGLQIRQLDSGIFLSQSKYAKNLVKKFGLEFDSSVRTPMSPNVKLTVDLLGKSVDSSL